MSSQFDNEAVCLVIQKHISTNIRESLWCTLYDRDNVGNTVHEYANNINHLKSMFCAALNWDLDEIPDITSSDHNWLKQTNRLKPEFVSSCIQGTMTVSVLCHQLAAINISQGDLSDERIQFDINTEQETDLCHQTLFKLIGNDVTNRIYVKQPHDLWALNTLLTSNTRLGEVSTSILNWKLGLFQLKLNVSVNAHCSTHCITFSLHLAYNEPVKYRTVVLYWQLYLHDGWQCIAIYQIPAAYTVWLVYVTQWAQFDSCDISKCSTQLYASRSAAPQFLPHLVDLYYFKTHTYAQYVFLWTFSKYTWYEAEHSCAQLGMHLASISSKEEYELVTGMLSGHGYGTINSKETTILTPCRTDLFICLIYIGMQLKVTTVLDFLVV